MSGATIVVPCDQESGRIDADAFIRLVSVRPGLRLLFVGDGASDDTNRALHALAGRSRDRVSVHRMDRNLGKGEALRQGLIAALHRADDDVFGYLDSDLSTPTAEIVRLLDVIARPHADVVLASRVAMLGCEIERSRMRHYLGRAFATLASTIVRVRIYDTQCAAKFFRRSDALAAAVATPFVSRLAFDRRIARPTPDRSTRHPAPFSGPIRRRTPHVVARSFWLSGRSRLDGDRGSRSHPHREGLGRSPRRPLYARSMIDEIEKRDVAGVNPPQLSRSQSAWRRPAGRITLRGSDERSDASQATR